MSKSDKTTGAAVTIGKTLDKMSESEKRHYACFKARCFYFTQTGIDLPIDRFVCVKDAQGDYVVTIKEA